MMATEQITDDAKAILLLCGNFGWQDAPDIKPLKLNEYNALADWLVDSRLRPGDLLNPETFESLAVSLVPVEPPRIKKLIERGGAMALATEKWLNKGLWILCRSDDDYPQRLKQHLKRTAPPILYGAGDRALLSKGGLAVVGSRHIDAEAEEFARAVGRSAAQSGMQLISGAARGVDETAMSGAFEEGGTVIGVVADSLLRAAVSGKYREGIRGGRIVLVSAFNPDAGFNVGNAMGRNKYIYALADFAVVVSSGYQEGGTWAGAEEELKRVGGRQVFVRTGADVPVGNVELLKLGARPFPIEGLSARLKNVLSAASMPPSGVSASDLAAVPDESSARGAESMYPEPAVATGVHAMAVHEGGVGLPATVYEAVKPLILGALDKPRKPDELARMLKIRKAQLQDWVKLLMKDGVIEERTIRKARKLAIRKPEEELKLQ